MSEAWHQISRALAESLLPDLSIIGGGGGGSTTTQVWANRGSTEPRLKWESNYLGQEKWYVSKVVQDKLEEDKLEAVKQWAKERNERQFRLRAYEQKLHDAGLDLGELIELIKARQDGDY
jgi:hypothetical protein